MASHTCGTLTEMAGLAGGWPCDLSSKVAGLFNMWLMTLMKQSLPILKV